MLFYSLGQLKEADQHMQKTCTGQVGVWSLLINDVLDSTQDFQCEPVLCCSVCANGTIPAVDVTRIRLVSQSTERQSHNRSRRSISVPQEAALMKEFSAMRSCVAESRLGREA